MATRDSQEQNVHDRAIKDIAINPVFYPSYGNVVTNPGSEKNHEVGGQYPDIIFLDARTGMELEIGEVETESSVNEREAITQWQDYAKLKIPFTLFVPDSCLKEASDLIKRYNISATIHLYHYRFGFIQVV